jgi:hypothetical protein
MSCYLSNQEKNIIGLPKNAGYQTFEGSSERMTEVREFKSVLICKALISVRHAAVLLRTTHTPCVSGLGPNTWNLLSKRVGL